MSALTGAVESAHDHRITFVQNAACGAFSGIVSRTITAPLDVLKISLQVGEKKSRDGLFLLCKRLSKSDGIRGFFKGNMTGCIKLFPHSLVHFLAYNQFKWYLSNDLGRLTPASSAAAGILSSVTSTIFTYPLDVIKTRLIMQPYNKEISAYKSITHAVLSIVKMERFGVLYNGIVPTLIATIPFAVSTFMTYELLEIVSWEAQHRLGPAEVVIQGSIASTVAMIIIFPFDVIRRKMQAKSSALPANGGVDIEFTNARSCFRNTINKYGVVGLWRGLLPAIIRIGPYHGLMFLLYDLLKKACLYKNGYRQSLFETNKKEMDQNIELDELREALDYDVDLDVEFEED